ncbi:MAG: isochorismate synthase, partial [Nitriliruptoraceae bacterium]
GVGPDRFAAADDALRAAAAAADIDGVDGGRGTGLIAMASFTFDPQTPGSVVTIPRVVICRRDGTTWMTRIDPPAASPIPGPRQDERATAVGDRPRYAGASMPDVHWLEAVAAAIEHIRAGDIAKIVLARDYALWSKQLFDTLDIARRLNRRFSSCHTFVVDGLVGATPETLVRTSGNRVTSRVLAGTAARDRDAARDAALSDALLASDKDRREHALAVASVIDVLHDRSADLTFADTPQLLRLDNVQHLATDVAGTLDQPASAMALAGALHPTAAVGGTPRDRAMTLIRALEGMDRGRYAAPVGWADAAGDGEFGIALRCAHIEGARARLFAGVGIVEGSRPEDELAETRLKLLAMQDVLGAKVD